MIADVVPAACLGPFSPYSSQPRTLPLSSPDPEPSYAAFLIARHA